MAKFKQGILGPISGSLGNLVGCIRYGVAYLRTKPVIYHDAKKPEQVAQRNRNKACVALYHSLRFTIGRPIWNKMAHGISGYNLFLKVNSMTFDGEGKVFDFDNLKFSVGNLPLPDDIDVQNNSEGTGAVTVSWTDNSGRGLAAISDRLRVVTFFDNKMNELKGLPFNRKDRQADIRLPFAPGDTVHLYLFFQNEKDAIFSESIHAQVNIP
jgi:hypothetical protein